MKNYSSNRAQKGKTAYRTPSRFKVKQSLYQKIENIQTEKKKQSSYYSQKQKQV